MSPFIYLSTCFLAYFLTKRSAEAGIHRGSRGGWEVLQFSKIAEYALSRGRVVVWAMRRSQPSVNSHATSSIQMDDVGQILVQTTEGTFNTLIHHHPRSGDQAKFSMEFCCVAPFLFPKIRLEEFCNDVVCSSRVQSALRQVHYEPFTEDDRKAQGFDLLTTLIDVRLKDGREFVIRGGCIPGWARNQ